MTDEKTENHPARIRLESLRSDGDKETGGDWVAVPELPGVELKVRSFNYPPYRIARDQLMAKIVRKYKRVKSVERDAEAERGFGELYATHILLDWRGLDIDYTPARALEEMTHPQARVLRAAVEYCANIVGEPDIEFLEDAAKNSAAPSDMI